MTVQSPQRKTPLAQRWRRTVDAVIDGTPTPLQALLRSPSAQGLLLGLIALAILVTSGPFSYTSYVLLLICVYAISVFGLNMTIGYSGVLSLGQGASFALGAYIAGILASNYAWPLWLTLPLSLVGGFIVGLLIGLPAGRLAALGLAMISLGAVLVVSDMLVQFSDITGGHSGISGVTPYLGFGGAGAISSMWFVPILIVVMAVAAYWFHAWYRTSSFGQATVAVKDEALGASAMGIRGYVTKVAGFAIGSGMAGIAGALFTYLSGYISPDAFSAQLSILFLVMAVLGGLGSRIGPLVGVVLLVTIPLLLAPYPHVNVIVYGLLLVVLMRLRPRGLFSRTAAHAHSVRHSLQMLRERAARPVPRGDGGEMLVEVHDVRRSFGGLQALDGVSLQVKRGEILGLIGPNGSGKTTILNIIGGYYHPDEGAIVLDGEDISRLRPHDIARRGIARTFQTPKTFDGMSIDEHIEIARTRRLDDADDARIEACQAAAGRLLEYGGLNPDDLATGRRESRYLAHGQLRFLEAAMAVARCPKVLLLDEPAAGLSASEIDGFEAVIKELAAAGIGVIIVEHHLEMISRLVHRVAVLDLGKLLWAGPPEEMHSVEAVRIAYMGTV
nr:branched-chain amino acid ABC transporter ATP-binding protein/permease [Microbacterium bovistercoris]